MPLLAAFALVLASPAATPAASLQPLQPLDVFDLEWATDPQVSPDGRSIAYLRNWADIRTDRRRRDLWLLDLASGQQRPLTRDGKARVARFSPDGTRLAWVMAEGEGPAQLSVRWLDSGQLQQVTRLPHAPEAFEWSPDSAWFALQVQVPGSASTLAADMPKPPEGAEWAEPVKVIDKLNFRADGAGFLDPGYDHLFLVPAEGGTARQLTSGDFDHGRPTWTPDGKALLFSANRAADAEYQPLESEIYRLDLDSEAITRLTTRKGPDQSPVMSPDGRHIAYVGFDDREQFYQVSALYLANADGSDPRLLTAALDRDVQQPRFSADGRGIHFMYDDHGDTRLARIDLKSGRISELASGLGGEEIGRPYGGASYGSGGKDVLAYPLVSASRPAEVAVLQPGRKQRVLTRLNEDVLARRRLAQIEELTVPSSHDGLPVQAWVLRPPGFDPQRKYPLLLEIHGGPVANYGPRFAPELQLYAARGYVVVYANPRGSDSYGEKFGNAIHHAYPAHDYDDLISVVDAVIAQGSIDPDQLYVTGGSGGGVLTAWIVGHTERFRAAVVAKPVINWYSFALTSDGYGVYSRYWFPGPPWEHAEHYLQRSPISHVGKVVTPTMVISGESDLRTPISEAEQFYAALKLRRVPTALVRIPGASHSLSARPSNQIAQVLNTLAWFEKHRYAAR